MKFFSSNDSGANVNVTLTNRCSPRFCSDESSTEASKKKKKKWKHNDITSGYEISIISDRVVKSCGAGFFFDRVFDIYGSGSFELNAWMIKVDF